MDGGRIFRTFGLGLALITAALPGSARAAETWSGGGHVEYVLVHKFHTVVGACDKLEGKAVLDGTGPSAALKVMARAPVSCFDTGNSNRDTNAMATVDAAHHPLVILKGTATGVELPKSGKATIRIDAVIELKGQSVTHPIDLILERKDAETLQVSFDFPESLDAHQVERPSLLLVKVEDALKIRGTLAMRRTP